MLYTLWVMNLIKKNIKYNEVIIVIYKFKINKHFAHQFQCIKTHCSFFKKILYNTIKLIQKIE